MSNTNSNQDHGSAFSGPTEFAEIIRAALARAARENWPSMVWSDPNFNDWPLGERSVVDSLHAWAGKGRHLLVLAHDYQRIVPNHPRWVTWRKTWDHIIECRVCRQLDRSEIPSALWSPTWAMQRIECTHSIGLADMEPQRRVQLKETLDECRRQSAPGFPATTLGL